MNLEARETARLYNLLTDKLGGDIAEAMFKYIDNKTERSVETTIKTLATKEDLAQVKFDLTQSITKVNSDLTQSVGKVNTDLREKISDSIKWMFIFWIGQVGATLAIVLLFLKK